MNKIMDSIFPLAPVSENQWDIRLQILISPEREMYNELGVGMQQLVAMDRKRSQGRPLVCAHLALPSGSEVPSSRCTGFNPGWCSLAGASYCALDGGRFLSQLGHMLRLWGQSLVGRYVRQWIDVSLTSLCYHFHSFSLSSFISLQKAIN